MLTAESKSRSSTPETDETGATAFESVDVLFIDDAGQMALADVLAVLIGDPQQLERPLKGSHPVGAEKSALQHLIG